MSVVNTGSGENIQGVSSLKAFTIKVLTTYNLIKEFNVVINNDLIIGKHLV